MEGQCDTDICWLLGPRTENDDWELRFSMRSFFANYLGQGRCWVIGRQPGWLNTEAAGMIPWPNPYGNKDGNLLNAALRLALDPRVSDPFILCSDDHFLLRPSAPEDFKYWHSGPIPLNPDPKANGWRKQVVRCGNRLRKAGFSALEFESHIPFLLKKEWLTHALRFAYGDGANTLFTTILNCAEVPAARLASARVRGRVGSADMAEALVLKKLRENQFLCLNNHAERNPAVQRELPRLFPAPCPAELC